jgi:hypothetical protein
MTALTIIVGGDKLGKILKKMHERIIKNFITGLLKVQSIA